MIVPQEERLPGLEPEHRLIAAVLRQVLIDTRSPNPATRAEAQRFVADRALVEFWTGLVGLDAEAFLARVQRLR